MTLELPPLPPTAQDLCQQLNAPPRLVGHLQLVHEAAEKLIWSRCPSRPPNRAVPFKGGRSRLLRLAGQFAAMRPRMPRTTTRSRELDV